MLQKLHELHHHDIIKIRFIKTDTIHFEISGAKKVASCSHLASFKYFTESINTKCPFRAYPCASPESFLEGKCLECHAECSTMGYHSDKGQGRGSLYLATQGTVPYCSKSHHCMIFIWV